jgi:hypothetical protein
MTNLSPIITVFPEGASKWVANHNSNIDTVNSDLSDVVSARPLWNTYRTAPWPAFLKPDNNAERFLATDIPYIEEYSTFGELGAFLGLTLDSGMAGQTGTLAVNTIDVLRVHTFGYMRMKHTVAPGTRLYAGVTSGDVGLFSSAGGGRLHIGRYLANNYLILNPNQ